MKALRSIIAATVLSLLSFGAFAKNPVAERAIRTTHRIVFRTVIDGHACSATAIGPHTLLTATHCELGTDSVVIDGTPADILAINRDLNEHSILFVNYTFKSWAAFAKTPATIGDRVFIIGNPGELSSVYREGYVSSTPHPTGFFDLGPARILYDLNGYHGDSGAALFNEAGEIVCVVSATDFQSNPDDPTSIKLMVGFIINFTEKEETEATLWTPEKKK